MDGGGSGAWGMGDVGFRLAWGGSLIAAPEKIRFNVTKWPEKNAIMLFVGRGQGAGQGKAGRSEAQHVNT
eukprot:scaffold167437_cov30-Tisochrysis_lutea.AAC.1